MKNNRIIYLYLMTGLIAFLISGVYIYLEECYSDNSFVQKTSLEKELYLKYCTNPLSLNPYDNYYSKLENYLITLLWLIGSWNLFDGLLAMGILKDANNNPDTIIKRKDNYKKLYNKIYDKLSKCKFITKTIYSRKNNK